MGTFSLWRLSSLLLQERRTSGKKAATVSVNLTDDEGEEGFLPFDQIIVMEVVKGAIFPDLEQKPD